MTTDYCIKAGYRSRAQAETIEQSAGDYWNEQRIAAAARYQWDVYEVARDVADCMGSGLRIADVGCGYPAKALRLLPYAAQITAIDQATLGPIVTRDFPDLRFCPIDLERPRWHGAPFDLVVCADVVEHLLDPDPCLRFLRELLVPHGILLLSTPERDILRGPGCMSADKPDHVREWNQAEFLCYVRRHGLDVVDALLLPPAQLADAEAAEVAARAESRTPRTAGCQLAVCVRGELPAAEPVQHPALLSLASAGPRELREA